MLEDIYHVRTVMNAFICFFSMRLSSSRFSAALKLSEILQSAAGLKVAKHEVGLSLTHPSSPCLSTNVVRLCISKKKQFSPEFSQMYGLGSFKGCLVL